MLQMAETIEPSTSTLRIGLLLNEAFDFFALADALEQLRQANEDAGCTICEWQVLSHEGGALKANNGIATATVALDQAQPFDVLIRCGEQTPAPRLH